MSGIYNDVINEYNNTGATRYSITFEYDHESQVKVRYLDPTTNEYVYVTDWEFDGATAIRFTGVVPDSFEIFRATDISQSFGTAKFAQFVQGGAIRASDLNGDLELLRQAIEENANTGDKVDQIEIDLDNLEEEVDAINNGSLDYRYVEVTGDTMTGPLEMSKNFIRGVKDPILGDDAVNLSYLQDRLDNLPSGNLAAPPYFRVKIDVVTVGTNFPVEVNKFTIGKEVVTLNGTLLSRNDYGFTATEIELEQPVYPGDVIEIICTNFLVDLTNDLSADNITYTYPDGVEQTLQKRLEQYVSVIDFGADPTGGTDSSAAVQAAINAADHVVFPAGTYRINSTINLRSDTTVAGLNATINVGTTGTDNLFHGLGAENVTINGLKFINQNNNAYIIYFNNDNASLIGPTLYDLDFENNTGIGGLRVESNDWDDTDWQLLNEPDYDTWTRWRKPVARNIRSTGYSQQNAGASFISFSGVSGAIIEDITISNNTERGVSLAFFLDSQISNVSVNTTSNGAGGSNPHGVYVRTGKRANVSNINVNYADGVGNGWGLRLSRGVYYSNFSNINVNSTNTAGNLGGIGFLGGSYNTFTGGVLITPRNSLVVAPHQAATVGSGDSSFANCQFNRFSDFYVKGTNSYGLYVYVANMPVGESPYVVSDNVISDCIFESDSAMDRIAYIRTGDRCNLQDCTFLAAETVNSTLEFNYDQRQGDGSNFSWNVDGCRFEIKDKTIDDQYHVRFLATAGHTLPTSDFVFNDNYFGFNKVGISSSVGVPITFTNNTSYSETCLDIRDEAVNGTVRMTHNFLQPTGSGAGLAIYVPTLAAYFTHNTLGGGEYTGTTGASAVRNGASTTITNIFSIAYNRINLRSRAFRDLIDDAKVQLSFNDISESIVSTIGSNVDSQNNIIRLIT